MRNRLRTERQKNLSSQKNRIRKNSGRIGRMAILLFALVCLYLGLGKRTFFHGPMEETSIGWDLDRGTSVIPELGEDTEIRQEFYAQSSVLNYIYLALDGHGQTGSMIVTVYDSEGNPVASTELPCSQMIDAGAQGISFHIRVKPGEKYSYSVRFSGITDEYPQILTAYHISGGEIGALSIDGEEQVQSIYGLFVYQMHYTQNPAWWMVVICGALLLLFGILYPVLPVRETRLLPLFLLLHAALGIFLLEYTAGTNLADFAAGKDIARMQENTTVVLSGSEILLLNLLIAVCLFLVLSFVLWNGHVLLSVGSLLFLIIGIAEYYILEFRGTPLVPYDLGSIFTANAVAENYTFEIQTEMIGAAVLLVTVCLLETKLRFRRYSVKQRLIVFASAALVVGGSAEYLSRRPLLDSKNNGRFFWVMDRSYQEYGFLLGTWMYEQFQSVEKPEGYSAEAVLELETHWEEQTDRKNKEKTVQRDTEYPNIIAIMNESLTDFASVGGIETTEPILPFLNSLTDNTVRGNLYISMYGGGTANSEFEFLTGSSMRFLPSGSTPYRAYIHEELPSLVSWLDGLGYQTLAAHFENPHNWDRDEVYPLLGFDEFISYEDGRNLENIRIFVSDESNYREVISRYEDWKENGEKEHFFCFNITMQNHGGYLKGYEGENAPKYTGGDADVNEYLALINESDKAFEMLIDYFRQEEEPTIILMFGDHWPKLNEEFIDDVLAQPEGIGDLERNQNKYVTPFLIWANYDIDEREYEHLSANYLGSLLLETAGLPMNAYQTFLAELMEQVPVMNSLGFVDADGTFFESADETDEETAKWILDAQTLQYAHLFGSSGEQEFFTGK